MKPFGYLLLLVYLGILFLGKEKRVLYSFWVSLFVSIFIGLGQFVTYVPYWVVSATFFLLFSFVFGDKKLPDKRTLLLGLSFLVFISLGIVFVALGLSSIEVLPLGSDIDQIVVSGGGVINVLSMRTLKFFILSFLMVIYCWRASILVKDFTTRFQTCSFLYKAFLIVFFFIISEFLITNFAGVDVRIFYSSFFGTSDNSLVSKYKIGSFYSAFGFWTEPSGVSKSILFFFLVAYKGIQRWKDLFYFLVAVLAVLLCRSTTAYLLLAACVAFLLLLSFFQTGKFQKLFFLIPFLLLGIIILLPKLMQNDYVLYNLGKIIDFFKNQQGQGSGYIRSSVILFNINVFLQRPLLGAGIASCDCHGILFGLLSNIGILGLLSYLILLGYSSGFRFSILSISLLAIFIGFCCGCYTLSDAFSPFFFVAFLSCYSLDVKSFQYSVVSPVSFSIPS